MTRSRKGVLNRVLFGTNQIIICSTLLLPFLPAQHKPSHSLQSMDTSLFLGHAYRTDAF